MWKCTQRSTRKVSALNSRMKVELFWPWRLLSQSLSYSAVCHEARKIYGLWRDYGYFFCLNWRSLQIKGSNWKSSLLSQPTQPGTYLWKARFNWLFILKRFFAEYGMFSHHRGNWYVHVKCFSEKTEGTSQKNGRSCIWAMCWRLPICITHSTWSSNGSPKPPSVLEIQEQPSNHDCSDKSEKHRASFQLRVPNSRLWSLKKLTWCSGSVGLSTANLFRPQSGVLGNIWRGSTETVLLVSFESKLIHHVCSTHQALRIELEDTFTWLLWETLLNYVSCSFVHNLGILDENKCSENTKI